MIVLVERISKNVILIITLEFCRLGALTLFFPPRYEPDDVCQTHMEYVWNAQNCTVYTFALQFPAR